MKTRFDVILETVSFILETNKGKKKKASKKPAPQPAAEPRPAPKPDHPLLAGLGSFGDAMKARLIAQGVDPETAESQVRSATSK